MIGAGVPTGAATMSQPAAEKPGMVSATVGRSGNSASRCGDATAISFTCPAFDRADDAGIALDDHGDAAAGDIGQRRATDRRYTAPE